MVDVPAFMPSKKERLLKGFGNIVADLQLFFRSRPSLTENEQLFIENRLMILQVEYNLWTKRPIKVVRVPKKDPFLRLKANLTPSLPSLEILKNGQAPASEVDS